MVKKGGDGGLVEKIADLVHDKKIAEVIRTSRTSRTGAACGSSSSSSATRSPKVVLNQLYKHTPMQTTFGVNMVALVDNVPRTLPLRACSASTSSTSARSSSGAPSTSSRGRGRAHVLEGLLIALDNLDAVIELIRASRDRDAARERLIERFSCPTSRPRRSSTCACRS